MTGTLQLCDPLQTPEHDFDSLLSKVVKRYKDRNVTSYFDSCDTFRSLCCQLWRLECNWSARPYTLEHDTSNRSERIVKDHHHSAASKDSNPAQPAGLDPYQDTFELPRDGPGAWRLKLDPVEGTIITTGQSGGVQVHDHSTKVLLWHIPKTATRPSPHLEFSNGHIVFDRPGLGHFEVWRSERLVPDLGRPPDRGHYQRLCIIGSTRPIRAYRFQYPILAMASQSGFIELWNVPDQTIMETINVTSSIHNNGNITYIDFDDEFVFLTGMGAKSVSVFSRQSKQLAWNMGQHFANGGLGPTTFGIQPKEYENSSSSSMFGEQDLVPKSANLWQDGPNTMNLAQLTMMPWQIWSAVHPDTRTSTLLILGQGTVLLIRDYKEYFRNTTKSPQLFIEIELWNLRDYNNRMLSQLLIDQGYGEDPALFSYVSRDWNNRRLWEQIPEAQMTVHEGKVFIINVSHKEMYSRAGGLTMELSKDVPFILNLEGGSNMAAQAPTPPIRVWKDRESDDEIKRDAWHICSCVQMDEVSQIGYLVRSAQG